ncbi:Efflux pump membrane transporter BepG [Planctomycetes bacterium Poly30]|uniref:Efflux pump membrane transporter BepG n=1 Tax=Saltatorellus ferox TaxID=2528018 RepID=A0A518EZK2_9BACT|nr:Efflux pump membrane transporter BepG [Planctomycetes bacterium Poly30]
MPESDEEPLPGGWSTKLVAVFLSGPLPALIMVGALIAGFIALSMTPREEEPQIVVPLADVHVSAPGLSAAQVERQVAARLEKVLSQIDGVEYVYSQSWAGGATVTARFFVGEDREDSLVKLYDQVESNIDLITPEIASWIVKPIEIDDVPIVIASLWSDSPELYGHGELRRIAEEFEYRLQAVEGSNQVSVVGGWPREVRVELDPEVLAARRTSPLDVVNALQAASYRVDAGSIEAADDVVIVEAGGFLRNADEVRSLVINVVDGIPVNLGDVAEVIDGPEEATDLTWIGFSEASKPEDATTGVLYPAVHLTIAKKAGTNAVAVAARARGILSELERDVLPGEVHIEVIRDQGHTAKEKVDELVEALGVAMLTVVLMLGVILGWRAAFVIALAIPVCYGATLLINMLAGYTINRVTLFALILALGLLIDDPITDVENIERYFRKGKDTARRSVLKAVAEVRPALITSTVTIILSFIPLVFITGMMGPYMAPMALNVPLTVTISTVIAFCVTPFLALKFLRGIHEKASLTGADATEEDEAAGVEKTIRYRVYNGLLRPMLRSRALTWAFLGFVGLLFVGSLILPMLRVVPLKMLPYDNKGEFQLVVDLPEGSTLERTDGVVRELAAHLLRVPEVVSVASFAGVPSPMDFNGLVRHDYLRLAPHLGDLRVQLMHKTEREQQSHEITLRLRDELTALAEGLGATLKIVEIPPGPPVLSTITAEIRGEPTVPYSDMEAAGLALAERLRREPGVVDVDTTVGAPQRRQIHRVDSEKAALSGISTVDVARTIALAVQGVHAASLEDHDDTNPPPVRVTLPRELRGDPATLGTLQVAGRAGIVKERDGGLLRDAPQPLVALGELVTVEESDRVSTIHHKNLERIVYVTAEIAGRPPADIVLDVGADQRAPSDATGIGGGMIPVESRTFLSPGGNDLWELPAGTSAGWSGEGEWKITLDIFRDLGIAFGAANLAIFLVLLLQTGSILVTLVLMAAIPLTMIGIMPGFWLLGLFSESVGGYPNPTYFTATAMIGMIALSGIVVRNSLVLVQFVEQARGEGLPLEEALVQSGAIRVRPILLTAGTTFLGNIVITLDPVFSGLAWAIIFGIAASTLFSLLVVPLIYNLIAKDDKVTA